MEAPELLRTFWRKQLSILRDCRCRIKFKKNLIRSMLNSFYESFDNFFTSFTVIICKHSLLDE